MLFIWGFLMIESCKDASHAWMSPVCKTCGKPVPDCSYVIVLEARVLELEVQLEAVAEATVVKMNDWQVAEAAAAGMREALLSIQAMEPCKPGCDVHAECPIIEKALSSGAGGRFLARLMDAHSYAAEIAQGVSHYPHGAGEPCIRCGPYSLEVGGTS